MNNIKTFLDFVAGDLYKEYPGGLQDVIVVLPTRRAGAFFKQSLGRLIAGDKPYCAPECTTLSDLTDRLCPFRKADEIETVCLLYKIYKEKIHYTFHETSNTDNKTSDTENSKELTLDAFYGWGRQLIEDFNNIDKSYDGINSSESILENSKDARHFDVSKIDCDVRIRIKNLIEDLKGANKPDTYYDKESVRREFERLWEQLPEIYNELTERLAENNCKTEGGRSKWLVTNFKDALLRLQGHVVVFAGFNLLLHTEREFMRLLNDEGKARFYWDYDEDTDAEPYNRVFNRVKENYVALGGKIVETDGLRTQVATSSTNTVKGVNVVSAHSDNAQAHFISSWLNNNHHEGQTSAIVLCNEQMLEQAIFSIPDKFSGQVNITKGFPMSATPIYSDIAQSLKSKSTISKSALQGENGQNNEKRNGQTIIEGIISLIGKNLNKKRSSLSTRSVEAESASTIGDTFSTNSITQNEETLTWSTLLTIESLYQARLAAVNFFRLFEKGVLSQDIELSTLRNLFMRHLATIAIPFHGEPITDIQIIGPLETRALDFDNLLLLNVEEGIVPRRVNDKSFIPYYLRKYYELPTADEEAEVYAYNFFRLLRRAKNITVVYSEAQSAEGQKQMSRFVMQMLISELFHCQRSILQEDSEQSFIDDQTIHDNILSRCAFKTYKDKLFSDSKTQTDDANTQAKEVKHSLSPSAINVFRTCRMKFFIRYMLDIQEPDSEDAMLQPNEIGSLIHDTLQNAYKVIAPDGSVTASSIEAFLDNPIQIENAIDDAILQMNEDYKKHHAGKKPSSPPHYIKEEHPVEIDVAQKHVKRVLENDEISCPFTILGTELKTYFPFSVPDIGNLYIGGSIDRLDKVIESGINTIRVIDYKTGKYKKEKMKGDSIDSLFQDDPENKHGYVLQTLIYCLAITDGKPETDTQTQTLIANEKEDGKFNCPVSPRLLFTQKKLETSESKLKLGKGKESKPIDNFYDISSNFRTKLEDFVKELLNETEFPMADNTGSTSPCTKCRYKQLCGRISNT